MYLWKDSASLQLILIFCFTSTHANKKESDSSVSTDIFLIQTSVLDVWNEK